MAKSLLKASEMPVAASSSLFRGLDEVEMESIMPCIGARRREFDKDELVIRLGDRVSRVGLLRDKLLSYLTSEARRQGSPEFVVPFDRQGMAEYPSSELSKLRDSGV
jgi:hypothetical protein